jgi:hypothetical protein
MKPRICWSAIRAVLVKPIHVPGLERRQKRPSAAAKRAAKILNWTFLVLTAAFAAWRVSLEFRINSRLQQITKRGEPISGEALNRSYLSPPEAENAADVWLKGFEQFVPRFRPGYDPWSRLTLPRRVADASEELLSGVSGFLDSNRLALVTFHRAASLPKSRFPVDLARAFWADNVHHDHLRSAARLLELEAFVAAERRDADAAVSSIQAILATGRALHDEPTFIALLLRFGLERRAFESAERLLNCVALTDAQLQDLSRAFAATEDTRSHLINGARG